MLFNIEFQSCYLSEKTWGNVLAGIPFISTHEYPLDILQKIFNLSEHPFYDQIKKSKISSSKFMSFVEEFMKDFDVNYKKCKDWVILYQNAIISKLEYENTLLDFFIDGFHREIKKEKKII